ncbi:50S ribosomal protein L15 [Xylocopilactobacillus apicola]|uniref:Large ribosomal subunit protein uL15 n=1 Tax=Xylocopilactobacillus apicola TaxID=2932184 RepID=A0AAU9DLT4_9LACO|nr:50S ribosomal protein L15 [Xylocopilactobacillus apicola]BDR59521.1 50S ribosomal protein L15 [Xylocopilactobacillus apicola]
MQLNELRPAPGSRHSRKRLARGFSSGHGKTAGRGTKGQKARQGGKVRMGFEGGQMPLFRRIPKRGFNNINRKDYAEVSLSALNAFNNGDVVDTDALLEKGIIKKTLSGVKILGNGEIEKKLTVKVSKVTKSANEAIVNAGGTVEVN